MSVGETRVEEWQTPLSELHLSRRPFHVFDGRAGREGMMWVEHGRCTHCHADAKVLCVDASEDEYAAGCLCLDCINRAFNAS
jgi:hypothetical protein